LALFPAAPDPCDLRSFHDLVRGAQCRPAFRARGARAGDHPRDHDRSDGGPGISLGNFLPGGWYSGWFCAGGSMAWVRAETSWILPFARLALIRSVTAGGLWTVRAADCGLAFLMLSRSRTRTGIRALVT